MWIVNGELAYPVEEITVAGNLKEMFCNISEMAAIWNSGAAWPRRQFAWMDLRSAESSGALRN